MGLVRIGSDIMSSDEDEDSFIDLTEDTPPASPVRSPVRRTSSTKRKTSGVSARVTSHFITYSFLSEVG